MQKLNTKPYAIEKRCTIDLSLSENPLGCSPVVQKALTTQKIDPSKYPSANGNNLKKILAKQLNCSVKNIFVANGSESIIFTIPKTLIEPSKIALIPQLTFPLFRMGCENANVQVASVSMKKDLGIDLDAVKKAITDKTQIIFLCNPNNPTGMLLSRKSILQFFDDVPKNCIVVIDEANIDFGGESVIDLAPQKENVIVLRTFSKGFGLAGFRIGFAVGNEQLIKKMEEKTPPFPISSFSEMIAITVLSDLNFLTESKNVMDQEREKIKIELKSLNCTVFDSQANNIFARLPETISPQLFFKELELNNVSIVKGSKFEGCDDSFFRVSPKSVKINQQFLQIIRKILTQ